MTNGKLILLRHGQSKWNESNQFTGWVDVDLTEKGEAEAKRGGELLAQEGILPNVLYTSLLRRAIRTANIALDAADRHGVTVRDVLLVPAGSIPRTSSGKIGRRACRSAYLDGSLRSGKVANAFPDETD